MARDTFQFRLNLARGSRAAVWLAQRTGLNPSTVQRYLSGSSPSIENAALIAEALDVSLDWLASMPGAGPMRAAYHLKGRHPTWWSDTAVRDLVIASYRQKTQDEVVAAATALYGAARAPSRSSVGRVWQRFDRGHLIKGGL